jgi:hypothetical protein
MDEMLPPVQALQAFLDESIVLWNAPGDQPATQSQAALELANFSRPESVGTAYSQAYLAFEAAADYSWALVKTLTSPGQSIACWGCARSVVETSAISTWLWDVNINARQRVQRSLAFMHEGLLQQMKLARASKGKLDTKKPQERLEEVEKLAINLGLGKTNTKHGKQMVSLELEMPSVTQLITGILKKEENYRLLSAMVHGHHWALQSLSFSYDGKDQEIFPGIKGGYLEKHLDYSLINYLCVEALWTTRINIIQ